MLKISKENLKKKKKNLLRPLYVARENAGGREPLVQLREF